jgi:hypothetical protein
MVARRAPSDAPTRYRYEDIVARINWFIDEKDPDEPWRKRFYGVTNLDHTGFSHRMSLKRGMRFTVEQIGAMALEARWPEPFPWVDWDVAEAFQAFKQLALTVKK